MAKEYDSEEEGVRYFDIGGQVHGFEDDDERSYVFPEAPPDEDVHVQEQLGVPENDVTDEMLRQAGDDPDSWLTYNKDLQQRGYAPVDGIDTDNAGDLEHQYTLNTESVGLEPNPIIVPGDPPVMYFVEENITAHAVNARTGEPFWSFQPQLPDSPGGIVHSRGAAVYGDKVYFGTPLAEIVALDRYSGELQWRESTLNDEQESFGDQEWRLSITQAPMAYDGKILTGQSSDTSGWTALVALDAETGEQVWHETTAPEENYVGETWKFASNAAWMSGAIDPQSDSIYWSVGNPNPMYNGTVRPGPNKYSNSIVAVNLDDGAFEWENQLLPHELWDADTCNPPIIFDVPSEYDEWTTSRRDDIDEQTRVVSHDWKGGWNYILDAEDGRLLQRSEPFAEPGGEAYFEPVPTGVENEAPFFPIPAAEWGPQAFSPQTGLHYVAIADAGRYLWSDPNWEYQPENPADGLGGGHRAIPPEELEQYGREGYGAVQAIRPDTGEIVWEHRLEDVDPQDIGGRYAPGGTTVTASGVVLNGSSSGHLVALDADNGEQLGKYATTTNFRGQRIQGSPVVWHDPGAGRDFVSVASFDGIYTYATSE